MHILYNVLPNTGFFLNIHTQICFRLSPVKVFFLHFNKAIRPPDLMLKLLPCPNLYIFLTVYPEEFLPTYQNINEGATLSKPQLVSLHSDVELTYSKHPPLPHDRCTQCNWLLHTINFDSCTPEGKKSNTYSAA